MRQSTLKLNQILENVPSDPEKLSTLFKKGKAIPYAGKAASSNHTYAKLLEDLCVFSHSRGTCHEDITAHCFNLSELEVRYFNRNGFKKSNAAEVTPAEMEAYAEALGDLGITGQSLKEQAETLMRSWLCYGVAFLLNDYAAVGDASAFTSLATGIDSTILWDAEDGKRYAIYFPHGIERIQEDATHYAYRLFSSSAEVIEAIEKGELEKEDSDSASTYRYAFQLRNGKGPYGRPKDAQAIREMLTEAGLALSDEKISIAPTTARGVFTIPHNPTKSEDIISPNEQETDEDGNPIETIATDEDNFKAMAEHTRQTLDDNDLAYMPFSGDIQPGLLKIDISRDAKYRETMFKQLTSVIHAANRWVPDLTGITTPSGGIGSGYFKDLASYKNATVAKGYQHMIASFQNQAIAVVLTDEQFQDKIHAFPDPLEGLEMQDAINQ